MRRRLGLWLIRLGTRIAGPPATSVRGKNWVSITYSFSPAVLSFRQAADVATAVRKSITAANSQ
jgi:hypothetical protein